MINASPSKVVAATPEPPKDAKPSAATAKTKAEQAKLNEAQIKLKKELMMMSFTEQQIEVAIAKAN